jgi:nucleolar GTP-binding protein
MSFQTIKQVEDYQFYLDLAFRRSREAGKKIRLDLAGERKAKSKYIEIAKIQVVTDTISSRMEAIIKSFPSLDQLPEFYNELIRLNIDYAQLKKSLGAVNWLGLMTKDLYKTYLNKIKHAHFDGINPLRRAFLGRLSSMVKQIKDDFKFLEQARRIMKEFPVIKTSMKTVAIAGFPNVGKTTLLYKLTGSKPEISAYPFTTKAINVAYFKDENEEIQLLDTPGTLDRFDKMNNIEKIAYLAIKHCANLIVYVYDLTEEYDLGRQEALYKKLCKDFEKKIIIFVSKTDILDEIVVKKFMEKHKDAISDISELKKILFSIHGPAK